MKPRGMEERPVFDVLPLNPGDPKASAWGLWGKNDELGTINLLTHERTAIAAKEAKLGESISLNLPLDAFAQPMNPVRKPCSHTIIPKDYANDDEVTINTQGSSHWDGLRHYPYQDSKLYYNGVTQEDITGPLKNDRLGIQNPSRADLARSTIAGRGVLLDWYAWAQARGIEIDHFSSHAIPLAELQATAEAQGTTFLPGDILLVRTGWTRAYRALTPDQRAALPHREVRSSCGVEATEASIRWHWDRAFAAVASDAVAYEAWPSPRAWDVSLHEVFLAGWGMPIGESFDFEELALRCAELRRWTFMFLSMPMDIPGGVASPSGATAIL